MRCPCRKKSAPIAYADCCQPLHEGVMQAATAEALMRSRYAAFAVQNAAYVSRTWHSSKRPAEMRFTPGQEWQRLQIIATHTNGNEATVEFIARSRIGGGSHVLHEVSRFVREGGYWLYVDGVIK